MNKNIITVITPTYNRAHILGNCYNSLINQTQKDFVWMIIDDGSVDNTQQLIKEWQKENKIKIVYYKKNNGGKASALNLAFDKVQTSYLVCLDSDDTFEKNTIEIVLSKLEKIKDNCDYCGIIALRTAQNGSVLGGKEIPDGVFDIKTPEIENVYKINSEVICFFKTNVITKYRFPVIPNEKFISPAYLEYEVCRKYKFLVSKEVLCYCEYQEDGLTKNKRTVIKQNPIGYTIVKKQSYELSTNPLFKIKHGVMYICGSLLSNDKAIIKNSPSRIMTIALFPIGWLIYILRYKLDIL